jgi:16S rRNA (guanine527-N7)-methyltransferase
MNEDSLKRFEETLRSNMQFYGVELSSETLHGLGTYYSILTHWNSRLHLVAPCSPEEFAARHVLESLVLLKHLNHNAKVVDVGSGGGLPIIPCLIARPDLSATLIESSQKKAVFLREALNQVDRSQQSSVVAQPFEKTSAPDTAYITCRALEQFTEKLATLLQWAPLTSQVLLFGGESLREELERLNERFAESLLPLSEKRFLFVVRN